MAHKAAKCFEKLKAATPTKKQRKIAAVGRQLWTSSGSTHLLWQRHLELVTQPRQVLKISRDGNSVFWCLNTEENQLFTLKIPNVEKDSHVWKDLWKIWKCLLCFPIVFKRSKGSEFLTECKLPIMLTGHQ